MGEILNMPRAMLFGLALRARISGRSIAANAHLRLDSLNYCS